jgi:glycine/D-amino acid oxidase-like deaminating enzyme
MPASPSLEPRVAIVIGAGLAGLKAALKLAVQGMRVSVFDRQPVPSSSTPAIYAKLLRFPGVRVAGGVEVVDMWVLSNRRAVRGVRARLYGGENGEFFGDLVIDATRSPSRFDQWRGTEGYAQVQEVDSVLEKARRPDSRALRAP